MNEVEELLQQVANKLSEMVASNGSLKSIDAKIVFNETLLPLLQAGQELRWQTPKSSPWAEIWDDALCTALEKVKTL